MTSVPANPYEQWSSLLDAELTVDNVQDILGQAQDDLWVAAACVDRVLDVVPVQRMLLQIGLARTDSAVERSKCAVGSTSGNPSEKSSEAANNPLIGYFRTIPADGQLCCFRSILLKRLDRLNTYVEMQKEAPLVEEGEDEDEDVEKEVWGDEIEDGWDDPWAEEPTNKLTLALKSAKLLPIPLSTFLTNGLLWSACRLASWEWFGALRVLLDKHSSCLWPLRLTVLDHIPEHTLPSDHQLITPKFDFASNRELVAVPGSWRLEADFSETEAVQHALREGGFEIANILGASTKLAYGEPHPEPLSAGELAAWYKDRVNKIINSTGMVDVALALIQHGASQGIPSLDELGEELSLLSRLIYDTPQAAEISEDWTLTRWFTMDPPAVVGAYLANSTPETLPTDISRLVLPYLYVLEARAERAGTPDPDLPNRLLYNHVLISPLHLAASMFDASKPTLPAPQRIIKNDQDLVRVALACLYGSSSLNEWSTMSHIFECLPAWDYPHDEDNDEDAADTTIASLGAFVTPTTTHLHVSALELMTFFKPLHIASLSRALDILDVHLEAGEIFARWNVPAPLKWFLQSSDDIKEQRAWANRIARRAGGVHDQLNTVEDWEWLLEDMAKLTGKSETGIKKAFGLLSEEEVSKIFLSGLLSTDKFDIARSLLYAKHSKIHLDAQTVEEIVIVSSHELYDNAGTGNYKIGDMKLAYDCLDVPPTSDRLNREKEFIEATSRISSFNVQSRPGIPISPIEIRLTKDRLSLVSRVLSSNNNAYKHTEVILDLCYKLGFRGDTTAEVKTLAMLADTALQAEDFTRAYENTVRMVNIVKELREVSAPLDTMDEKVQNAIEVCWIGCFQLGRQPEFGDLKKKLQLLGYALEFCPPDRLHDVLTTWRRLEKEDIMNREEDLEQKKQLHVGGKSLTSALHRHQQKHGLARGNGHVHQAWGHASTITSATLNTAASSLRTKLQQFHMPSPPLLSTPDAAALASRTFRSVAANFPFSVGQRSATPSQTYFEDPQHQHGYEHGYGGSSHASESGHHRLDDVSAQASKVLSKGIGWLIGADDE
ncbi:hypothetical protein P691DRAFT_691383 [Macrolepiota fuliginosa MF-IS2]|uniref:Sec39 domain-containing protein n=1 Tax=Macrolepiota fuliginosa MF-IS2 TaxID=1400762 RepID=A0A9P5XSN6_9AGAR|nr:hypothetical protein P691DRAFT_691383 [Macrolepiota fuliginosa MF-IS2]